METDLRLPKALGIIVTAAVKRIDAVVCGQLVSLTVKREPGVSNAVGKASDSAAVGILTILVARHIAVAEHHISPLFLGIGNNKAYQRSAKVSDRSLHPRGIPENIQAGASAVLKFSESAHLHRESLLSLNIDIDT